MYDYVNPLNKAHVIMNHADMLELTVECSVNLD